MKELLPILIGIAVATVIFVLLWRKGTFMWLSNYTQETKEELRKCSWPTRKELGESTVVVLVSIALLGAFTIVVDLVIGNLIKAVI